MNVRRKKLITFLKYLILNCIIAAAYFTLGFIGLKLLVPHPIPTSTWLASGFALASIVLINSGVVTGIFIGNLLINILHSDLYHLNTLAISIISLNATLGPLIGFILIKRVTGIPTSLLTKREILVLLIIGGMISSIIPATFGVLISLFLERIYFSDMVSAWFNWWLTESIGIFIFTPLMFVIFALPRSVWKKRILPVGLPLLISLLLMALTLAYYRTMEDKHFLNNFEKKSSFIYQLLQDKIDNHLNNITSIQNLLISVPKITEQEFKQFISPAIQNQEEIVRITWHRYKHENYSAPIVHALFERNNTVDQVYQSEIAERIMDQLSHPKKQNSISHISSEFYDNNLIFRIPIYEEDLNNKLFLKDIISYCLSIDNMVNAVVKEINKNNIFLTIIGSNQKTAYDIIYSDAPKNTFKHYFLHSHKVGDYKWQFYFYHGKSFKDMESIWPVNWLLSVWFFLTFIMSAGSLYLTGRYLQTEMTIKEKTKDLIKAKNTAELANKTKDQFLAKISHELRTPLNGIIGFTKLLKKNPDLSKTDQQRLDIIYDCSEDLMILINDILDIAAIENKKIKISKKRFDLIKLLEDIEEMFSLKVKEKHLTFITHPKSLPRYIFGDPKCLKQVISNLLTNAVKYTDQGHISFTAKSTQSHIILSVEDSGCGISEQYQKLIFSPFVQINNSNDSKNGIGIGLAICNELAKLMSGSISVESTLGKGSKFTFTFPIEEMDTGKKTENITEQKPRNQTKQKRSILIADDNEINLLLLINLLDKDTFHIDSVSNGKQALKQLEKNSYDFALIDLSMPLMNGIELMTNLKRRDRSTIFIAMSAYANTQKIREALNSGFHHYLTKPIDLSQLNHIVAINQSNNFQ